MAVHRGLWLALQRSKHLASTAEPLGIADVKHLHDLIFGDAAPTIAGRYRNIDIAPFRGIDDLPPAWQRVPEEMLELDRELERRQAAGITDPKAGVELATWTHMELVRIHPFHNGNGRVARLALNVLLMRHVTGTSHLVEFPYDLRDRYINAVQAARLGDFDAFHELVAELLDHLVARVRSKKTGSRHII
jgi:Fic family protein